MTLQTHNAAELGKQSPDSIKSLPNFMSPEQPDECFIQHRQRGSVLQAARTRSDFIHTKHLIRCKPQDTRWRVQSTAHWNEGVHSSPHSWFTIVEIEGEIGREMEKYWELEAVQYLLWKQVQPINCETGKCLTSSSTLLLERVTNKLDAAQSLPWALRSLHVTEPWLLLTGDISSSQRKAKPLFLRVVTIWMNFCLHFRSVFLWHVLKNAAFITKWPFCSPGCVVPALKIAYLCKMWVVQVWHFLNNILRRVSSLSLSSYWAAVQLSLKTDIKPVGSCYLSPWPTLEPVQCSPAEVW